MFTFRKISVIDKQPYGIVGESSDISHIIIAFQQRYLILLFFYSFRFIFSSSRQSRKKNRSDDDSAERREKPWKFPSSLNSPRFSHSAFLSYDVDYWCWISPSYDNRRRYSPCFLVRAHFHSNKNEKWKFCFWLNQAFTFNSCKLFIPSTHTQNFHSSEEAAAMSNENQFQSWSEEIFNYWEGSFDLQSGNVAFMSLNSSMNV